MSAILIRGGRVVDPTNRVDALRDLVIRDGRIAAPVAGEHYDESVDASGCVVMAGGIDMHTHIGGGKVNLARLLMAEDHRAGANPIALPDSAIELASCGSCAPGTLATGYRYVEMGYTAAFEPAMVPSNARHAHMEMGDVPVLDHGAYVMLGSDELFLELLAQGGPTLKNFDQIRDYTAWTINASKAMGVKVVNPGGISAFKFNQRKLDVDEQHVRWQVTPRQVVHALARALKELGVPHPLHIHGSNLGVAGNIRSTLDTIAALEGLPAHLTHIQFHAYGTEGPKKFSSAAQQIADAVNANPQISIDIGQIMFGQTVTASGDTMRQVAQADLANPRKWVGADIELMAGCGVVPFRYREQSYVNALQWVIGLEIFLLVKNPWQVVLTTDHPNGGPFTSYPHLIRLLMDRSFREEQLAKLHPEVVAGCALKGITRELTMQEIAVMTRSGPAKLLGLKERGQLGAGAAADITIYREHADREAMFRTPEWVFKDGTPVAKQGTLLATPVGGTHFVEPGYDTAIEKTLRKHWKEHGAIAFDNVAITHDELCSCCNGGRLLPAECFTGGEA
ncbi:formylmethanofuran dehydrogenase subunit A [Piscinibacter sp.]|uniref:formylmethanofuran dehydrogenase subunit A n=1 Tax=Piscinibacter sp. TaxID=1903157 RepID=UPI001B609310|nr:formylmethanofuran dehydrogenase subunit A [Piscinibacter sp.]MBP5988972.1 formylmethanofuran dehydrogenase subunit A [Piscinibacter sp.]MBP6026308.1 formylmethanofuran dehydrogenase subunit A [Piscinibacter sp.]